MKIRNFSLCVFGALIFATSLLHTSCKKNPKGSFIVRGTLLDSCEGHPYSNVNLVVQHTSTAPAFKIKVHDSIGIGKTDANGNFEIVCQNWGEGEITIYTPSNLTKFDFLTQYEVENAEGKTYEFGNLYSWQQYFAVINLTKAGTFAPSDTLYFGGRIFYPISAGSSKEIFKYTTYGPRGNFDLKENAYDLDLYWGFGKNAYDNAVKNKIAANRITAKYVYCGQPDYITNATITK